MVINHAIFVWSSRTKKTKKRKPHTCRRKKFRALTVCSLTSLGIIRITWSVCPVLRSIVNFSLGFVCVSTKGALLPRNIKLYVRGQNITHYEISVRINSRNMGKTGHSRFYILQKYKHPLNQI